MDGAVSLFISILNNSLALMNVPFCYQLVIKGAVIVLAVLIDRFRSQQAA